MDTVAALLDAIALAREGRHTEAEARLHPILALDPDQPSALFLLGQCALATCRAEHALTPLARNLALRPTHRDGRLALARAQLAAGLPQSALDTLAPIDTLAVAHKLRGTALNLLARPAEAVAALTLALQADPTDAEAELNLGNAHLDLDEPAQAEHHIRRAIALGPTIAEAHASLGHLLAADGRVLEAVAAGDQAIRLRPDMATAHWNQGVALLLAGNLTAGWDKYEWRKQRFPDSFATLPGPQWTGGDLQGRQLLVVAEQGLGDTIQFARYLPLLAARGARVILECADSLHTLLTTLPGVTVCSRGERPPYDLWVDQMSLPRLFGTTLHTVPAAAGYLRADRAHAAGWDSLLPPTLRVGLAWAGNALHSNDRRRSMPADALAPLLTTPGCTFVSLQAGPRAGELPGVIDPAGQLTDWSHTAALVASLDLLITVDTAVAHLAGALAIPTWIMLPHAPDWRWMLAGERTPWYAATRLFRQTTPGDWTGVIRRVAAALADSLADSLNAALADGPADTLADAKPWPSRH